MGRHADVCDFEYDHPSPAKIYGGEGIAQILFLESDEVCQISYADKQGKYQRQSVLTPPKV